MLLPGKEATLQLLQGEMFSWKLYIWARAIDAKKPLVSWSDKNSEEPDAIPPLVRYLANWPAGSKFILSYQRKSGGDVYEHPFELEGGAGTLNQNPHTAVAAIGSVPLSETQKMIEAAKVETAAQMKAMFDAQMNEFKRTQEMETLKKEMAELKSANNQWQPKIDYLIEKGTEIMFNQFKVMNPVDGSPAVASPALQAPANPAQAADLQAKYEQACTLLNQKMGPDLLISTMDKLSQKSPDELKFLSSQL